MSNTDKAAEALRLAEYMRGMVHTYPQMSEDEPGGYCTEDDQCMDQASALLREYATLLQAQPAEAGRVPLTDDEIDLLMKSIGLTLADDNDSRMANHAGWERGQRRKIARAIEHHHGILPKEPDMDTKESDRELLKWAAKAAGYEVVSDALASSYGGGKPTLYLLHNGPSWNPLTDDGDALRLFLTIRGELHTVDDMNTPTLNSVYVLRGDQLHREWLRDNGNDPYAATRRAIVRAAAEIGRNMA